MNTLYTMHYVQNCESLQATLQSNKVLELRTTVSLEKSTLSAKLSFRRANTATYHPRV